MQGRCGKSLTGEAKILVVTVALFGVITVVQFFAASISRSTALLVDCASMLVDALTYAANLWAVCAAAESDTDARARYSLCSSGLSLAVLYGITAWGLADAIVDLFTHKDIEDDLDAWVVLGFGIGGLVFDGLALAAFKAWGLPNTYVEYVQTQTTDGSDGCIEDEPSSPRTQRDADDASLVNMFSALTHVVADSVRSVTSIVLGALVLLDPKLNGSQCDDYATLVVAATILLGSAPLLLEWLRLTRVRRDDDRRRRRQEGPPPALEKNKLEAGIELLTKRRLVRNNSQENGVVQGPLHSPASLRATGSSSSSPRDVENGDTHHHHHNNPVSVRASEERGRNGTSILHI
ncbi:hypothetical protein CTAYLR_009863 [Chrysophaeum taylorii]|uniref:Cation efflux protein transmembrane domain-containing protein n=1 Tax=Chrysophaeum taylorii TaxID=2483200 RepID=A0AAD7U5N8_9STRA|nr:hypothetical protein CTAYLR_009863 [Chrysophaeum taylorii]